MAHAFVLKRGGDFSLLRKKPILKENFFSFVSLWDLRTSHFHLFSALSLSWYVVIKRTGGVVLTVSCMFYAAELELASARQEPSSFSVCGWLGKSSWPQSVIPGFQLLKGTGHKKFHLNPGFKLHVITFNQGVVFLSRWLLCQFLSHFRVVRGEGL